MKNYLIAGANSAISKELIRILLDKEEHVTGLSRGENSLKDFKGYKHIQSEDYQDNVSELDLDAAYDGFVYFLGTINLQPFKMLKQTSFEYDMEINFLSAVRTTRSILPLLKGVGGASVVYLTTVAVQQGMPFHSSIAAAKGALESFMRSMAAEYAPKIRFNCVAPSLTNTPMAGRLLNHEKKIKAAEERHPLKRTGHPRDIAKAIEFLLSNDSAWMSGQTLNVDGGLSKLRI